MFLPLSPDVLEDVADRVAPALAFAARVAAAYARSWVRFVAVRAALRKIAPNKTRRFEYAVRVAPIVASYGVRP
jgi:hypothetical protein